MLFCALFEFKRFNARSARSLDALAVWSRQDTAALDVYTLPGRVCAESCSGALRHLLVPRTLDDSPACACLDVSGSGFCLVDLDSLSGWLRLRSGAFRPHIAARMSRSSSAHHRPSLLIAVATLATQAATALGCSRRVRAETATTTAASL